jgi:hypothetical protein
LTHLNTWRHQASMAQPWTRTCNNSTKPHEGGTIKHPPKTLANPKPMVRIEGLIENRIDSNRAWARVSHGLRRGRSGYLWQSGAAEGCWRRGGGWWWGSCHPPVLQLLLVVVAIGGHLAHPRCPCSISAGDRAWRWGSKGHGVSWSRGLSILRR